MLFLKGITLDKVAYIDGRSPHRHSPKQDRTSANAAGLTRKEMALLLEGIIMTRYLTLTFATALGLSALAAQADSQLPGDGDWTNYPVTSTKAPGSLTREAVIADLVASRKAGTLPRPGEWHDVPAPLGRSSGTMHARTMPATKSNSMDSGDR